MFGNRSRKPTRKIVWTWPHFEDALQETGGNDFSPISDDNGLTERGLSNMSYEQIQRDKKISRLLEAYTRAYEKKSRHGLFSRYLILVPCISIVLGFSAALGWLCIIVITTKNHPGLEELAAFITACVSFLALIINILHIVTEYFFPKDGEKYITEIVKLVQENDLKNRLESARFRESRSGSSVSSPAKPSTAPDHGEGLTDLGTFNDSVPPPSDNET